MASVVKWSQRFRATGSAAAHKVGGRRPYALAGERAWLLARLSEKPDITLRALGAELAARGIKVSHFAVWRAPKAIESLHQHNCIGFRLIGSGGVYDWELSDRGKVIVVKTSGTTLVTDATHARHLALAGIGIAHTLEPLVRRDIREGRLRWLLPQSAIEQDGMFLYYPRRASQAPKLRAFIDVAKAAFAR